LKSFLLQLKSNAMKNFHFLLQITIILNLFLWNFEYSVAQSENKLLKSFDKIIISPHIRVILTEGENESVFIENEGVDEDKINVEVVGRTLRIYLDQARLYTKNYKIYENGYKKKRPVYSGTLVTAHITYKKINSLSIRGEETVSCESPLVADKFKLKIFGESNVILSSVESEKLKISLFGENDLEILAGSIHRQKINSFGENKVEAPAVDSRLAKINTFGESKFNLNVLENIRVTAFGESDIYYKGDAYVHKVIVIGENKIFNNNL
jgi:hypothetical protein